MRSRALVVCLLVLALKAPLGAVDPLESTFAGTIRTTVGDRLELSGEVTGGLQGSLTMDLGQGQNVGGSPWRLAVRRQDGAGTWYDAGELSGTVVRGVLQPSADGLTWASDAIDLQITAGDGELANVTEGIGTLSFSFSTGDAPRASGTLTLTF
jgi:hypothetical protein